MLTTTRSLIPTLALTVLACWPTIGRAQSRPLPTPGDEIRVRWNDPVPSPLSFSAMHVQTMRLLSLDGNQLVGKRDDRLYVIGTGTLKSLERRIGTRPASAPEMVLGSGAGFVAGFVLGALTSRFDGSSGAMNAGLSTGVLLGAPLGALVTWISSRSRGIYEDVFVPRTLPRDLGR